MQRMWHSRSGARFSPRAPPAAGKEAGSVVVRFQAKPFNRLSWTFQAGAGLEYG
jgi:hypothetical protein